MVLKRKRKRGERERKRGDGRIANHLGRVKWIMILFLLLSKWRRHRIFIRRKTNGNCQHADVRIWERQLFDKNCGSVAWFWVQIRRPLHFFFGFFKTNRNNFRKLNAFWRYKRANGQLPVRPNDQTNVLVIVSQKKKIKKKNKQETIVQSLLLAVSNYWYSNKRMRLVYI